MTTKSKEISVKEIKVPFKHGEAPAISWGADFDALTDTQKIIYLKKFSASMNHATMLIQTERNELLACVETLKAMLKSAEDAVGIQKTTLVNSITESNIREQKLGQEIALLKNQLNKLAEVCDGDNS